MSRWIFTVTVDRWNVRNKINLNIRKNVSVEFFNIINFIWPLKIPIVEVIKLNFKDKHSFKMIKLVTLDNYRIHNREVLREWPK